MIRKFFVLWGLSLFFLEISSYKSRQQLTGFYCVFVAKYKTNEDHQINEDLNQTNDDLRPDKGVGIYIHIYIFLTVFNDIKLT